MVLDQAEVDPAADHRLQRGRVGEAFREVQPAVGQIPNPRREAEPQQEAQAEHRVGNAAGVGVMLPDGQGGFVVKQPIQDMLVMPSSARTGGSRALPRRALSAWWSRSARRKTPPISLSKTVSALSVREASSSRANTTRVARRRCSSNRVRCCALSRAASRAMAA